MNYIPTVHDRHTGILQNIVLTVF